MLPYKKFILSLLSILFSVFIRKFDHWSACLENDTALAHQFYPGAQRNLSLFGLQSCGFSICKALFSWTLERENNKRIPLVTSTPRNRSCLPVLECFLGNRIVWCYWYVSQKRKQRPRKMPMPKLKSILENSQEHMHHKNAQVSFNHNVLMPLIKVQ